MNCQQCQRELLNLADPGSPGPEIAAHLAECMACRLWQKRLLKIEGNVPLLPVPSSPRKQQLLEEIERQEVPAPLAFVPSRPRLRWRRSVLVAGGLAAALLIAAGIFYLSRPGPEGIQQVADNKNPAREPAPPPDLMGEMVEGDLHLAEADTPRKRVETLARLAKALHRESHALAPAAPKEMKALARLYGKVVRDGIVTRARTLPAGQRHQILHPIAEQLGKAGKEAEELARKAKPGASEPLLQIAAASRSADQELRALMKEETP